MLLPKPSDFRRNRKASFTDELRQFKCPQTIFLKCSSHRHYGAEASCKKVLHTTKRVENFPSAPYSKCVHGDFARCQVPF